MSEWLSDERRQKIQIFLASLVPLLILSGLTTDVAAEQILIIIAGAVLQFVAAGLSLLNLRGNFSEAWTIARGAIYALATTVAPALTVLGVLDDNTQATILTAVSLGLTALSSLVAIFVNGEQRLEEAQDHSRERMQMAYREGVERGRQGG